MLLFFLTLPLAGQQPLPPLDPARRDKLERALNARDYPSAEQLLVEAIGQNPNSSQLLAFLGGVLFLDGKYLSAAVALKKAEKLAPLDEPSRFTLAMSYVVLEHHDWARPELERLAEAAPANPLYRYWLGRLDYDAQHFAAAAGNLQKVLELDPNFTKAYDRLGLCFEALGDFEKAQQYYEKAVLLNRERGPSSPWPPLNLGAMLGKLGRYASAEGFLREALRYDPRLARARYQLGVVLEKQQKDGEAIRELSQAAALDSEFAEPLYALGRIYRKERDFANAEKALNAFRKLKALQQRDGGAKAAPAPE